jgi:hypothetical protein
MAKDTHSEAHRIYRMAVAMAMQALQMFMARTPAGENTDTPDTPRFGNDEGYGMSVCALCQWHVMNV